jgi:cellulose biosynthesis protein BcsQ
MLNQEQKVLTMLAGAGAEVVFYQRFSVASITTGWADFEKNLNELKPHLLIVQADVAPHPDQLVAALARLQMWNGVALVVMQSAHREFRGVLEKVATCRGVFVLPLNWGELVQAGYAAVATERARGMAQAPLQSAIGFRAATSVTGTRVVAFLSGTGGAGRSTLAENIAYELAVRMNVRSLLMSFDLPAAAAMHFNLRFTPNAGEFFARPGDGFGSAIQMKEKLDVIVAPENSVEYARAAEQSGRSKAEGNSIYSLVMASWTRSYAAVLLDLPGGEGTWTMHPLLAANTAVIVARPTLADLAATRHLLVLLLERMRNEHRIPQESIYMVLNQVNERSSITPRGFYEELAQSYGWAPPVLAVIPYDSGIQKAQDEQMPPVAKVDSFGKGVRSVINGLFPGLGGSFAEGSQPQKKGGLLGGLLRKGG